MDNTWISTKDRMPDDDECVLFVVYKKQMGLSEFLSHNYDHVEYGRHIRYVAFGSDYSAWRTGKINQEYDEDYSDKNVTHWMPLPDPPWPPDER